MESFDFALLLVILSGVMGLLYILGILISKLNHDTGILSSWWYSYSKSLFPIFFIVLVIRSFLFEPFQIPSGSMLPNLKIGDFIVVNRFSYGLRLPVINHKIIDINTPQRGDVVVFKFPQNHNVNFIKRVIGLPGDWVSYVDKQLFINNKPIENIQLNVGDNLYLEKLFAAQYDVAIDANRPSKSGSWLVPDNEYFVMGDNRDYSHDSRFWGTVHDDLLLGKAVYVWMQWDEFMSLPSFSANRLIHN